MAYKEWIIMHCDSILSSAIINMRLTIMVHAENADIIDVKNATVVRKEKPVRNISLYQAYSV